MAAKVALAALISLGLGTVGVATVRVVGAEPSAGASGEAAVAADCACGSADPSLCAGAGRRGHLAWNAASWLVGLALVAAVGRRGKPPAKDAAS